MREYMREYRSANPEYVVKQSVGAKVRIARIKAHIASRKNVPCADCSLSFPPECMDFDHVRGEKKFNLGDVRGMSKAALEAEIEKCDVVCANCHRIRTRLRSVNAARSALTRESVSPSLTEGTNSSE